MARGGSAHPTGGILGLRWAEVFSLQVFAEMKLEMVIDELEYAGKAFFFFLFPLNIIRDLEGGRALNVAASWLELSLSPCFR